MKTTRYRASDVMVTTTVSVESAIVDFDDIKGNSEPDYSGGYPPWESCDGWDHEFRNDSWRTRDEEGLSRGYVNCSDGQNGIITIDDADVIDKWGFTRDGGEAKQVWRERVARVKRDALDQLVKWYTDGWHETLASASYGDYSDSLGGILDDDGCSDYVEDCVEQCRAEVADQLEADGYTVTGRPEPPKQHNHIDRLRDHIRRNLNPYYK